MRLWRNIEVFLLGAGLLLLGVFAGGLVFRSLASRAALAAFKVQEGNAAVPYQAAGIETRQPDFSLWSPRRTEAYRQSLAAHFGPAIGILIIPKIHVEVPILDHTDDLSLDRGVGHIEGTSQIGDGGNIGIAGHRDGFFRGLKDVAVGDKIELTSTDKTSVYVIDRIVIVNPDDVSVLARREHPSITLVTCYPFYFVGSAPKRYIVQAFLAESHPNR